MGRVKSILFFLLCALAGNAQLEPVSVTDLLTLSSLSPKNAESYLDKRGFAQGSARTENGVLIRTFMSKTEVDANQRPGKSIDLYKQGDTYFYNLKTNSVDDYRQGNGILKKAGFFYDKDSSQANSVVFKKGGIVVKARLIYNEEGRQSAYSFLLQKKEFPDPGNVRFAEDLGNFESHDHLVNYFGAENVKKDVYQFSPSESANCSILFPNSNRQAVFIWQDQPNFYRIAFVVISGVIESNSTANFTGKFSLNKWQLRCGIHLNMRIKDLIELNGNDFMFYGLQSDYALMVVPDKTRYIDFRKVGVMLDCFDCYSSPVLQSEKISADEAAAKGLSLYVASIVIRPH